MILDETILYSQQSSFCATRSISGHLSLDGLMSVLKTDEIVLLLVQYDVFAL